MVFMNGILGNVAIFLIQEIGKAIVLKKQKP